MLCLPALSYQYAVCVIFEVKHDSLPKTIRFRDYSEANAEHFATVIDNDFFLLLPNEHAEYKVIFTKKLLKKFFPI